MFELKWTRRRGQPRFLTPSGIVTGLDGIEALLDPARYLAGIPSGLPSLDRLVGGLRQGTLTVLSGLPTTGRTALALTYVRSATLKQAIPTAILSPAMTPETLLLRLLAAESKTPLVSFTERGLQPQQSDLVHARWQELGCAPLYISESPDLEVSSLRRTLERLKQRTHIQFVVVDPIARSSPKPGAEQRLAKILKTIARDFDIALLVTTTPLFGASSADSYAAWEQHAARIMELRGPSTEVREGNADWDAEVVVLRNQNGSTGRVRMRFRADYLAFEPAT